MTGAIRAGILGLVVAALSFSCSTKSGQTLGAPASPAAPVSPKNVSAYPANGRLQARLSLTPDGKMGTGYHQLLIERVGARDGTIYVPSSYRISKPAPLLIFLHGNRWNAQMGFDRFQAESERTGTIFVFPESRKRTWDRSIDREFGPDVEFIDAALKIAFKSLAIDPSHVGISGFSDGASYALSLGQTNGDFFTHIIAFSPGESNPAAQIGRPPVFVIQGVEDDVLPIDQCARVIAPALTKDGYTVSYHEFEGQHLVTDEGKRLALDWFITGTASTATPATQEKQHD